MAHIEIQSTDEHYFITLAIEEWRVIVEQSNLRLPEILVIQESEYLSSDIVWNRVCSAIKSSPLRDSNCLADFLTNNKPSKFINGKIAEVLITATDPLGTHNNSVVCLYSNRDMRSFTSDMIKLVMFHELEHMIRLGVNKDELISHIDHEFKADVFAMLAGYNRVGSDTMLDWWLKTVQNTNPLTGRMQTISHDLDENVIIYPIVYVYPFIQPLLVSIQESGEPLELKQCLELTDQIYDTFETLGLNEQFKQAVRSIAKGHLKSGFGKEQAYSSLPDADTVVEWVLSCYLRINNGSDHMLELKTPAKDQEWFITVEDSIQCIVDDLGLNKEVVTYS